MSRATHLHSLSATRNPTKLQRALEPIANGFVLAPWVVGNPPPPYDVPMPAKTFSEPISLTNQAIAENIPTTYILYVMKGQSLEQANFYPFYVRAKARGWTTHVLERDHNAQRSHPVELVHLLEQRIR